MKLFHQQCGDGSTVELRNDLEGLTVEVSVPHSHPLVNIYGVHGTDGRVGSKTYTVSVDRVRGDFKGDVATNDYDYIFMSEGPRNSVLIATLVEQ